MNGSEIKTGGEKIDLITHAIDTALADNEQAGITDTDTLTGEVWQSLSDAAERGECTIDQAMGRYRSWHNQYVLGRLAARGEVPANVIGLPTSQPPLTPGAA